MASIDKRTLKDGSVSYRVTIRKKGYPMVRATFKRHTDAKRWADKTEADIIAGRHIQTREIEKHTLEEAADKYISEIIEGRKNSNSVNQRKYIEYFKEELGEYYLTDITAPMLIESRNTLVGSINEQGRVRTASTANRYLTGLSHLFTIAINEWEWARENPIQRISKLKEPRGRVRFLSDDERQVLLEQCQESKNPYLYLITILALSTGARKNEILRLRWQDVDLNKGKIIIHETKNGERRALPLQSKARQLMQEHSKVRRLDCDWVFPRSDGIAPIDIKRAWDNAVIRAGINDFRFHDLRHSTASYLAMNGASLTEIAEILGHKTLQMVKRYAHLSEGHVSSVVERMNDKIFG